MTTINARSPLFLSDGTAVALESVTRKGNIRVTIPAGHPLADGQGNGRIFDPRTGRSTKGSTSLLLSNTAPAVAASAPTSRGDIDVNAPLVLSDGTPVTFVKRTPKGRIQVKLPDGHPFAVGQDNGRIFFRESGKHFKGRTDLVLSNAADSTAAPTAAAAPTSNFGIVNASGSVLGDGYPSFDDAARAAVTMLADGNTTLDIVEITTAKVGSVGVSITRA